MGETEEVLDRLGSEAEESGMKSDLAMEIDDALPTEGVATAEDWRRTLAKVVPSVVVLRTNGSRAFDTESAGAGYATGFIVDKTRGIILTNRHVVKPGKKPFYFLVHLDAFSVRWY